jgi:hypothetical protein
MIEECNGGGFCAVESEPGGVSGLGGNKEPTGTRVDTWMNCISVMKRNFQSIKDLIIILGLAII